MTEEQLFALIHICNTPVQVVDLIDWDNPLVIEEVRRAFAQRESFDRWLLGGDEL